MGLNLAGMGAGFGGWAAGNPSAAGLAGNSLGLQTIATGTSALGNLFEGIGGYQEASYASQVMRQNAQQALEAGQNAEEQAKLHYGAFESRQKAAQASSGVGVNSSSALAVRRSTEEVGAMDEAVIHYNAARQAYGENVQAGLLKRAAGGALTRGIMGAGASLLGGAAALSDKSLSYRLAFGDKSGNPMTIDPTKFADADFMKPFDGSELRSNVPEGF